MCWVFSFGKGPAGPGTWKAGKPCVHSSSLRVEGGACRRQSSRQASACGTPYKRCTWARNGKKRVVWRCVSRLEFGKKYCYDSPSLNEYGTIWAEVKAEALELAGLAQSHSESGGVSLLELKQRLDALMTKQAALLDKVLADMDNLDMNDQLRAVAEEKQSILEQMWALEKDESQRNLRTSRQQGMEEWLERQPMCFTEYDDADTRRFVERITVVAADTIQVKIRDDDVLIDETLP